MRSNLRKLGKDISPAIEVTNLSHFGFWLFVQGREFFLPFSKFPWFREANVNQICNVVLENKNHFYWPDLDIDLDLDRIKHPEKYPLISK